jgi:hypothetical protein
MSGREGAWSFSGRVLTVLQKSCFFRFYIRVRNPLRSGRLALSGGPLPFGRSARLYLSLRFQSDLPPPHGIPIALQRTGANGGLSVLKLEGPLV